VYKRLGTSEDADEIMKHEFFKDIDQDRLQMKALSPPIMPKTTHNPYELEDYPPLDIFTH